MYPDKLYVRAPPPPTHTHIVTHGHTLRNAHTDTNSHTLKHTKIHSNTLKHTQTHSNTQPVISVQNGTNIPGAVDHLRVMLLQYYNH